MMAMVELRANYDEAVRKLDTAASQLKEAGNAEGKRAYANMEKLLRTVDKVVRLISHYHVLNKCC